MVDATPQFFYFDMGNVLLRFDHEIACRQMAEVSGTTPERVRDIVFRSDLELKYERGDISTRQFYEAFCARSATRPEFGALRQAAARIFELNNSMVPVITQLRAAGHRIGILSNTCEAHWDFCVTTYRLIRELFHVHALSYQLRSLKPDLSIYRAAAELAELPPSRIFFADDRAENVLGAQRAGFDAVRYTSTPALVRDLQDRGIQFNSDTLLP